MKFRRFDWFIALLLPRNSGVTAKIGGITRLPCYITGRCSDRKSRDLEITFIELFHVVCLQWFVLASQKTVNHFFH